MRCFSLFIRERILLESLSGVWDGKMARVEIRLDDDDRRETLPVAAGLRVSFVHKITLLLTSLILLTALSITALTSYQFRQEIYNQEYRSALTVYTAVANYLTAHYKSQDGRYNVKSIDYVLRRKFLRIEGDPRDRKGVRPERVLLYDTYNELIYAFEHSAQNANTTIQSNQKPDPYGPVYDPQTQMISIGGSVSPSGDAPGYVLISFKTRLQYRIRKLFFDAFLCMLGVTMVAIGLSWIFARRVLAPIEALSEAARKIHRGDSHQRVEVSSNDEIGELARTFNEMAASIDRRLQMLHNLQNWTVRIGRELETHRLYVTLTAIFTIISEACGARIYAWNRSKKKLETLADHHGGALPRPDMDRLALEAVERQWICCMNREGQITDEDRDVHEIAIPLSAGRHRVGVVRLAPRKDGHDYDEETLAILLALAQHASVAIENAHLYSELAEKERIEQEMRWAREIQQSLLPHSMPRLPGFDTAGVNIPANEVGGDYYDYIAIDEHHHYFVIADVSGKGVPAGLVMSITRSLIRTYAEFEHSPGAILKRVNRTLSDDMESEMFVTAGLLMLDPATRQITIARAGHEPLMWQHADGNIERLEPSGTALALLDVASFDELLETQTITLAPGERVLLYTDGVTEARDPEGHEFGYEHIERVLGRQTVSTADELVTTLLDAVKTFEQGEPQRDDITLVCIHAT